MKHFSTETWQCGRLLGAAASALSGNIGASLFLILIGFILKASFFRFLQIQ